MKYREILAEASVTRILHHIRNGAVFIMISAMRANLNRADNMLRTRKLGHILNGLPVSHIDIEGEYWETGAEAPSRELSFFVMASNKTGKIGPEQLRRIGEKLMHDFDQDAIIFGDGMNINLVENDGSEMQIGDNTTFDPAAIAKLPGFSMVKGRKFGFTPDAVPARAAYADRAVA